MKNCTVHESENNGGSSSSSESNMNSNHEKTRTNLSQLRPFNISGKYNLSKVGQDLVQNSSKIGKRKNRRTTSGGGRLVPPPIDGGSRPLSALERQMFPGIIIQNRVTSLIYCDIGSRADNNVAPIPKGEKSMGAQLTIFYQGSVNVYDDVSLDKAKAIMHLAVENSVSASPPGFNNVAKTDASETIKRSGPPEIFKLRENLPMTTRRSLMQFFDKRRDRIMKSSPYASSSQKQHDDE